VPGHEAANTICHHCRRTLIERKGYALTQVHVSQGRCRFCGTVIPGRWEGC
jgi:pyruvate formate lyase activating enzyme